MNVNDNMIQYYLRQNNNYFIKPPYIDIVKIGSDLLTLNAVSSVVQFTVPAFANRIAVYYDVKGTVSSGTIRLECSPISSITNWATMNIDQAFTSANSNSLLRKVNSIGPYHYVRARVIVAIAGGAHVDVYLNACN